MNLKNILIYLVFAFGIILVICLGYISLIRATMADTDTFPNYRFILTLILMIIVTWTIGLGLRKHRSLIVERNK